MPSLMGFALAGAAQGFGEDIMRRAQEAREAALRMQEREWDLEDDARAREHDFDVMERREGYNREAWDRDRAAEIEDRDLGHSREDAERDREEARITRDAAALRYAANPDAPTSGAFVFDGLDIEYRGNPEFQYGRSASRNPQPFRGIVFHHTAAGSDTDAMVSYGQTVDEERGGAFGYHFYIGPDGRIVQGAPLEARTNHIKPGSDTGLTNSNSIGISMVGAENGATPEQEAAARRLTEALAGTYGINEFYGHGELQNDRMHSEGLDLAEYFRSAVDPNTPSDVREAVRVGLGLGDTQRPEYSNITWVDRPDGTQVRMGFNSATQRMEPILGQDGEPVTQRREEDEPEPSEGLQYRVEQELGLDAENLAPAVLEEVMRVMREDDLSESEAMRRVVDAMVYETTTVEGGGFLRSGEEVTNRVRRGDGDVEGGTWTGIFDYGNDAEDEPPAVASRGGPETPAMPGEPDAPEGPSGMPSPRTQAEYEALPSGTRYLAPDGQIRVKS